MQPVCSAGPGTPGSRDASGLDAVIYQRVTNCDTASANGIMMSLPPWTRRRQTSFEPPWKTWTRALFSWCAVSINRAISYFAVYKVNRGLCGHGKYMPDTYAQGKSSYVQSDFGLSLWIILLSLLISVMLVSLHTRTSGDRHGQWKLILLLPLAKFSSEKDALQRCRRSSHVHPHAKSTHVCDRRLCGIHSRRRTPRSSMFTSYLQFFVPSLC